MPTIPLLEGAYEEDSTWRASDPNAIAVHSLLYQREWMNRHDDTGRHDDPLIPMEAATVTSAGAIIQGSSGISVSRLAQGKYLIDVTASPFLVDVEWFAHTYADPVSNDVVWGYESNQPGATVKTTGVVEVRFVNDANNYVDTGFWVGCFGTRG